MVAEVDGDRDGETEGCWTGYVREGFMRCFWGGISLLWLDTLELMYSTINMR